MVGATNDDRAGQDSIETTDMPYMPATAVGHTRHDDGMTLHTLDPDPDSDIELYDDNRAPHRSGNPPESDE